MSTDDAPTRDALVARVAELEREGRRDREAAYDALHTRAVEADALRAEVDRLTVEVGTQAEILTWARAEDVRLTEQLAAAEREVQRLTERLGDAEESLRVEREDRARTLVALRDCATHVTSPIGVQHAIGARSAYRHAADLVERGGR